MGFQQVNADVAELHDQVLAVQQLQQRQLESNSRLEESMAALVHAANGLRSAEARDVARPVDVQAIIGNHAARHDRLMQMQLGALLRA